MADFANYKLARAFKLLELRAREFRESPNCIDRNRVQIAAEFGARAARKSDDAEPLTGE